MRHLLLVFAFFGAVLASTGCAVYTPSGSIVVDPAGPPPAQGGGFCPPGQAKKGRC